jgi:formate dehydrogenase maturation protein FdhE
VETLPLEELALPFHDFLSRVAEFGTDTIKNGAQALLSQGDEPRLEILRSALDAWGINGKGKDLETKDEFFFYSRAFLEPVVTSIAQADSSQPPNWTQNFCFTCGGLPQVAVIRDLPDALGHRSLTCSMCATEWRDQGLKKLRINVLGL